MKYNETHGSKPRLFMSSRAAAWSPKAMRAAARRREAPRGHSQAAATLARARPAPMVRVNSSPPAKCRFHFEQAAE